MGQPMSKDKSLKKTSPSPPLDHIPLESIPAQHDHISHHSQSPTHAPVSNPYSKYIPRIPILQSDPRPPVPAPHTPPKVIIVGAGLGGLFLAILLERANIPYTVFEASPEVNILGAIMCLNSNAIPVFEQLGLYDQLLSISIASKATILYDENLRRMATLQVKGLKKMMGFDYLVFPRPDLYAILLAQIPEHKILRGKRVAHIAQDGTGATITCEGDSTAYTCDILVGADGAYSSVRRELYGQLSKMGKLPPNDHDDISIKYITVVGMTKPLGEIYSMPKQPAGTLALMIGTDSPYTWSVVQMKRGEICWNIQVQLGENIGRDNDDDIRKSHWQRRFAHDHLRDNRLMADSDDRRVPLPSDLSDRGWISAIEGIFMGIFRKVTGPCASLVNNSSNQPQQSLLERTKGLLTPFGTLETLMAMSEEQKTSQVFLEDKLFQCWHHGRVVLIGDACHKLLPSVGQGAINAMQDATVLANCIYEMNSSKQSAVEEGLQSYYDQRFQHVQRQYDASKVNAELIYGQTVMARILRYLVFVATPSSLYLKNLLKDAGYRPQATFLPKAPHRGTCKEHAMPTSARYESIQRYEQWEARELARKEKEQRTRERRRQLEAMELARAEHQKGMDATRQRLEGEIETLRLRQVEQEKVMGQLVEQQGRQHELMDKQQRMMEEQRQLQQSIWMQHEDHEQMELRLELKEEELERQLVSLSHYQRQVRDQQFVLDQQQRLLHNQQEVLRRQQELQEIHEIEFQRRSVMYDDDEEIGDTEEEEEEEEVEEKAAMPRMAHLSHARQDTILTGSGTY